MGKYRYYGLDHKRCWDGHQWFSVNRETYPFWMAAPYLVPCDYCGARIGDPCHTFGESHKTRAEPHGRRAVVGRELLCDGLRLNGDADVALDAPPLPPLNEEDVRVVIRETLAEMLPKPRARRQPQKRTTRSKQ